MRIFTLLLISLLLIGCKSKECMEGNSYYPSSKCTKSHVERREIKANKPGRGYTEVEICDKEVPVFRDCETDKVIR